ncbi:ComF family protein [Rhodoferax lacus]|uniref:ComF family protein n=1 Tax=Rhodoferax lacus TaxID=2184758 RepID=A0A3E1RGZ4_9BURK|nr:ComF family protein [Rhodoferax lacus]RFO98292.1 ComF family protein [Rhodoferax lacus]
MFRRLLQGIAGRLPSQCAVCHAWPARAVCDDCVQRFAQPVARCHTCALPVLAGMRQCGACLVQPPPVDQALAVVPYDYPWAGLITQFKFQEHTGWAHSLATLLRAAPWVEPALDRADWLLPLPLSPRRLQERGFNQTLVLARALLPDKVQTGVLLRVKDTAAQSSLPRAERLLGVRGAYALEPTRLAEVQNKRIVLLDDVMTTGATLFEAARVLRRAGALHITALVVARTE